VAVARVPQQHGELGGPPPGAERSSMDATLRWKATQPAARPARSELPSVEVQAPEGCEAAYEAARREGADALV
jgi:hypothetical protein